MRPEGEGWLFFAGTVLGIAGIMRIFDAIWAFRYHGAVPNNLENAIFGHSLKTYGWVYLVVAAILLLSSFGVMARSQFSRWIGIFAGAVMAIERGVVDAVLPGMVPGVHLHRRSGHLRLGRLRKQRDRRLVAPHSGPTRRQWGRR